MIINVLLQKQKVAFSFKGYDDNYTTTIKGQVIKQMGYLVFENDLQNKKYSTV